MATANHHQPKKSTEQIGDARQLFRGFEESLNDFAEHTSAHGIPRAFSSRTSLKKCLWLLLFFVCLTAFSIQAYQIIMRFFRNDIIVGVELKFENIPFPSVTVCNSNPYKNSLARTMGSVRDTLQAFDDAMGKSSITSAQSEENQRLGYSDRKKRQIHRLYEKMYSDYEGLLAVYSICSCPSDVQRDCTALKDNTNGTMCLCFYNRKNDQIWPCYRTEQWTERRCQKCSPLGDCVFSESEGQLACVCAPVIRMCVRIEEQIPEEDLDENKEMDTAGNSTHNDPNATNSASLVERIPKIWEISAAKKTPPEFLPTEQLEEKENAYGLKGLTDPIAIRSKAAENLIFAVNSLSETEKSQLSYSKREFITKCSFNGRQCFVDHDFSVYIDPSYGNCFTFNYNSSENMRSERAGANYGLRFQVFVNISDYLPTTEAAGVRITVHSQEEQPFPDTHGYNAPTGFVSSFGIRLKRINRLPAPYGDCIEEGKNEDYIYRDKEYSTEGCQRSCIQKYLVKKCGCGDPRFPRYRNTTNCPVANSKLRECLRKEIRIAARASKCECKQPCKQQVYSVSYSCARWPAGVASLSECDASLSPTECLQFHREQGALIEVYFEQLNYESLMESEAYGLPNLLSDFGGQLGLWMGVSVITIMEKSITQLQTNLIVIITTRFPLEEKPGDQTNKYKTTVNAIEMIRTHQPCPREVFHQKDIALCKDHIA
ncbi:amiloride-sensitive sodium channel domain-containing protein [Ditylenchus destructor]|nr:amiloride-sensitive sodium channel domain-containing protein [Ditylenchus destructor]